MKTKLFFFTLLSLFVSTLFASLQPGRIIYFADGNIADWDDMGASPVSLAILAKSGAGDKCVVFIHSDNLWGNNNEREVEQEERINNTIRLFGGVKTFPNMQVFNAIQQTEAALNAVIAEIRKSTASDPLWFVSAGPMPMEGEALERYKESLQPGEVDKRQYVHLISHGAWNERKFTQSKSPVFGRDFKYTLFNIKSRNPMITVTAMNNGPTENADHFMKNQNGTEFNTKTDKSKLKWMINHTDPGIAYLWDCINYVYSEKNQYDFSDAGMIWYLTQDFDDDVKLNDLKELLEYVPDQHLTERPEWAGVWYNTWDRVPNFSEYSGMVAGEAGRLRWKNLEPKKGVYDFTELKTKLQRAKENDYYFYCELWTGENSPNWIYDNGVPKVNNRYPYYLNEDYKNFVTKFFDTLAATVASYDPELIERFAYLQPGFGSTGDRQLYKSKPKDPQYEISKEEYVDFMKEMTSAITTAFWRHKSTSDFTFLWNINDYDGSNPSQLDGESES